MQQYCTPNFTYYSGGMHQCANASALPYTGAALWIPLLIGVLLITYGLVIWNGSRGRVRRR